jgi:cell division transport system ATP-binding protein
MGTSEKKTKLEVMETLALVGLEGKKLMFPIQLSAGELQRVAIARAIIGNRNIILADEPTGNLDPDTSEEIVLLLREISRSGTAIVMATHDYQIIRNLPSRIIKTQSGSLLDNISID